MSRLHRRLSFILGCALAGLALPALAAPTSAAEMGGMSIWRCTGSRTDGYQNGSAELYDTEEIYAVDKANQQLWSWSTDHYESWCFPQRICRTTIGDTEVKFTSRNEDASIFSLIRVGFVDGPWIRVLDGPGATFSIVGTCRPAENPLK